MKDELVRVVRGCKEFGNQPVLCKVIIETALLTDEEKKTACRLASESISYCASRYAQVKV